VIVIVNDVPAEAVPLTVSLEDAKGHSLEVGSIHRLDTSGTATLARRVAGGLEGFVAVVVRSADGSTVLRGTLVAGASVNSPSP
jgi:hypothetical protein